MPTGPATVADSEVDKGRPSPVQSAPPAWQSVVSGSRIATAPAPSGSTVIVHPRLLPDCRRFAFRTAPPVTANASSRKCSVAEVLVEFLAERQPERERLSGVLARHVGEAGC